MLDLQKASILKRISAYILDFILLVICVTGFAFLFSAIFNYDEYSEIIDKRKEEISQTYNVDFNISEEERLKFTDEEKAKFDLAVEAFENDVEANKAWNTLINLIFFIISFSILFSHIVTEFIVPLIFGNGQTIGKKVFALGVMRSHHVKLKTTELFIRAILGKCTMEAMFPIFLIVMISLGALGFVGVIVLFLFIVLQLCLIIFTKNNCLIHDILSDTVVVDMSSQMIFDSDEALLEYQKEIHLQNVSKSPY